MTSEEHTFSGNLKIKPLGNDVEGFGAKRAVCGIGPLALQTGAESLHGPLSSQNAMQTPGFVHERILNRKEWHYAILRTYGAVLLVCIVAYCWRLSLKVYLGKSVLQTALCTVIKQRISFR